MMDSKEIKVFILRAGRYHDYEHILGVFSTYSLASAAEMKDKSIKRNAYDQYEYWHISEYDLDKLEED